MLKKCSQCGLEKDIDDFYLNYGTNDGHASMCKECQNKISTKYAKEHKEKIKKYRRERYLRKKQEFIAKEECNDGFNKRDN